MKIIPSAFGLDMSDSSFKFVQLKKKNKNYDLAVFGEGLFPKGAIEGGKIKKPSEVAQVLKEELSKHRGKGLSPYVVASLPDEEVFLKSIRIPILDKKELESTVMVEAERNLPIQANNSYLSYKVLNLHDENDHTDVLVGAARKDVVDSYADLLTDAGLRPVVIEPEVIAISRSAIKGSSDKAVIITEIGANRTRLITFSKNSVVLTGSVNFSTNEATESIAKSLGLELEKAQQLRWDPRLLKDPKYGKKIEEALNPIFERLADSVNNYMGFLQDSLKEQGSNAHDVEKLIISGGGARLPGIVKQLSLLLQKQVEPVNPWVNVLPYPLKETPELSYEESVRYTTAIGLALKGAEGAFKELYE
ncbi:MAG: type IV pilus assembly protein PilM [Candidatus Spechtbacterales bacterium]